MSAGSDRASLVSCLTGVVRPVLAPSGRVRELVRSAFWLVPAVCVACAIGLAIGLVALDHGVSPKDTSFLFPGPPEGARSLLSAVIGAMITFTGLVFSITIVVLSLTSGQFSPRVIRTFLRDRTIRLALGVFLATFVYAMIVLREVGGGVNGVPRIAVTGTLVLVLTSVAVFIHYVAHVANMIRLASIVESIRRDAAGAVEDLRAAPRTAMRAEPPLAPLRQTLPAARGGVIAAIDVGAVVQHASARDCEVVLVPMIGDFVPSGGPLFRVHGGEADERGLNQLVSFDRERTLEQDLAFAFRQLVDIAQRALSPAVNDPTTATQAIDVVHQLLRELAPLRLGPIVHRDEHHATRLVLRALDFGGYLELAVGEILPYVERGCQVPRRLHAMLTDLATVAREEHRAAIARWSSAVSARKADDSISAGVECSAPIQGCR